MKIKSWLIPLGLAATVALTAGCVAVAVGAGAAAGVGTYAYLSGELKSTQSAALDRTWAATQAAMKDLEFAITSQRKDALEAELIARTASDKKVTIRLKKVSEAATEVRIRVGFGDKSLSLVILEKIKNRL